MPQLPIPDARTLLAQFCDDIDVTGGVTRNEDGRETCVGDDWPDLAATYLKSCALLGREPKWAE